MRQHVGCFFLLWGWPQMHTCCTGNVLDNLQWNNISQLNSEAEKRLCMKGVKFIKNMNDISDNSNIFAHFKQSFGWNLLSTVFFIQTKMRDKVGTPCVVPLCRKRCKRGRSPSGDRSRSEGSSEEESEQKRKFPRKFHRCVFSLSLEPNIYQNHE